MKSHVLVVSEEIVYLSWPLKQKHVKDRSIHSQMIRVNSTNRLQSSSCREMSTALIDEKRARRLVRDENDNFLSLSLSLSLSGSSTLKEGNELLSFSLSLSRLLEIVARARYQIGSRHVGQFLCHEMEFWPKELPRLALEMSSLSYA